jgi:hypothetical protein
MTTQYIYPLGINPPLQYTFNSGTSLQFNSATVTFANKPGWLGNQSIGFSIPVTGIPTSIAFGSDALKYAISPTGISTGYASGSAHLYDLIHPTGIPSSIVFGSARLGYRLAPAGITTHVAFGTASIGDFIECTGIPTHYASGTAHIGFRINTISYIIHGSMGVPTIKDTLHDPGNISSYEAFGSLKVGIPVTAVGITELMYSIGYPAIINETASATITNLSGLIGIYSPALFNQLRTLEVASYAAYTEATMGAKYTALSNAIVAYLQTTSWTSAMLNYMSGLYGYITVSKMYGSDASQLNNSDMYTLFGMDGYANTALTYASSYYSDWNGTTSPHMDTDIATITGAVSIDQAAITTMVGNYTSTTGPKLSSLTFNYVAPSIAWTQAQIRNTVFNTLHYANFYRAAKLPIQLPPPFN